MARTKRSWATDLVHIFYCLIIWTMTSYSSLALCPLKCVCDEDKLTVLCNGAGLDIVPITLNPELNELILTGNLIKSILSAFTVYRKLKYLDVSLNQLVSLGDNNFVMQKRLEVLHLNRNMLSNINNGSFTGLANLKILSVRENFLKEITNGVLHPLEHLEELDLYRNRIQRISEHAFTGLRSLKRLNLRDNLLTHIATRSFQKITQLKSLDYGLNSIKIITGHSFHSLSDLEELNLDGCDIHAIKRGAFKNLNQLRTLTLNNNELSDPPTVALQSLSNLQHLRIGQNRILSVKPLAFSGLYSLKTLNLDGCPNLKTIHRGSFADNSQLEIISVNYNKELIEIEASLFEGLTNLIEAHLRGNSLKTIPYGLLEWNRIEIIDVRDNPIECNCSLVWFRNYLRDRNLSFQSESTEDFRYLRCAEPNALKDVLLMDTTDHDLGCNRLFYLQIWIASALGAGLVVVFFIIAGLVYRTRVVFFLKKKYQTEEKVQPTCAVSPDCKEEKNMLLVLRGAQNSNERIGVAL